jgi:glycosyltransferase involved in cell wall biosynthesis
MSSHLWTALFGLLAAIWVVVGLWMVLGIRQLPRLSDVAPLADAECPSVSILVAARDEEAKLAPALGTLVAQDYPRYEVVAVDDRSRDATPQILDEFARKHTHLKVIHLSELPKGWLGKPHALTEAYRQSSGEWLVFTDADVRFAPDLLRRAVSLARANAWDHLAVMPLLETEGFWEKTALTYWSFGFFLLVGRQPEESRNPRSGRYMGVGAFQLLRRSTYEAVGTHRRLAMEVIDDVKLGKLVKLGGFRSRAILGLDSLRLRYETGLSRIIRGFSKNFFAAARFRVSIAAAAAASTLALSVLPFVALAFTSGWARVLCGVSVGIAVGVHAGVALTLRVSPFYSVTHPVGALILCYMMARSAVVTLWQGGVRWRDTFYPLDELRKGQV